MAGSNLDSEGFLDQGQGSAFESRPSELVLIQLAEAGLDQLPDKVEQLVGRGFHNVIVSLGDLSNNDNDALKVLMQVKTYLGTWAGSLRLCNVSSTMEHKLNTLGVDAGLTIHPDSDSAVAHYRDELGGDILTTGESSDLALESSSEDPDDWGWGTDAARTSSSAAAVAVAELFCEADELRKLDSDIRKVVARGKTHVSLRLHFDRPMQSDDVDELIDCRDYLIREGGQLVLVSLPAEALKWLKMLEFDREFLIVETAEEAELAHQRHASGESPESVAAPVKESPYVVVAEEGTAWVVRPRATKDKASVRRSTDEASLLVPRYDLGGLTDRLAGSGAIVDLQQHRDAADTAFFEPLRRAVQAARQQGVELVFANVSHEVRALLNVLGIQGGVELNLKNAVLELAGRLHAKDAFEELRLELVRVVLDPSDQGAVEPISSVEFDSGISLAIDEPALGGASSQEVDALRVQVAKAQGEASRAQDEIARVRSQLDDAHSARDKAQQLAQELQAAIRQEERRLTELEQARLQAEKRAVEAETHQSHAKGTTQRLESEVSRLRQELDEARSESKTLLSSVGKVGEMELALREREAEIHKLKSEAKEVVGNLMSKAKQAVGRVAELESSDAAELRERCLELQEEKAKILTEAESEIERLTQEQTLLREELESAGEMIERLGKELELS